MAELPELMVLSKQMNDKLKSKEFGLVDVVQEKCLNIGADDFQRQIRGKTVKKVYIKGKWIFFELSDDYHLLLNLGMGADVLYYESSEDFMEEYQCRFHFTDDSGFTCKFWWFGHVELIRDNELGKHKPTKNIAISPFDSDFTLDYFRKICKGRSQIKNLMLNQKKIGGIGNVYIHDILFKSKIHPQKPVDSLEPSQIDNLFENMIENLKFSLNKKGLAYEKDFYGENGGFTKDLFLVAYKEGEKCPDCFKTIEKIKTGSTSSYICPQCQKL
ncbi:MAG: formamidopyrimidine-DNA glycosylase [Methanobacterium sp.]|jgi:formamidopyrimidine-DNA glycosylase|nr:formamidopyrimidine-DNA glycosylase [Methanobacterium sp.]